MKFQIWLETFLEEKQTSMDYIMEVEGPSGINFIPVENLFIAMCQATTSEQRGIRRMLVEIDFHNKKVLPYLEHLAKAIAL